VFWLSVQLYAYPVLVRMEKPRALGALRTAVLGALANPLFSLVLVLIVALFTVLGLLTIIFFFLIWPALMALLGEHSFRLFLARAGVKEED
jgi:uncharacterized membrane protein